VELIVAIVILAVGVLGLASTAAVVTRQIGGGAQQTRAAAVAQTRFETLRAMACDDYYTMPYAGTADQGGFREAWSVDDFAGSTNASAPGRVMLDSVFYDANGTEQVRVFRSMRTC
jgi:Tfp pilus assembly protein PilV